jgi:hypothetical protein
MARAESDPPEAGRDAAASKASDSPMSSSNLFMRAGYSARARVESFVLLLFRIYP